MRQRDQYAGRTSDTLEIGGEPFQVTVHWAVVGGQRRCVGMDVRGFTSRQAAKADLSDARPLPGGSWGKVTSPVIRAVPVGAVVEQAQRDAKALAQAVAAMPLPQRQAVEQRPPGRPGRAPRWSREVLAQVVAPAYLAAASKPSMAVLEALLAYVGPPAANADPAVTADMARKAVQAARKAGLLPAANERGTR